MNRIPVRTTFFILFFIGSLCSCGTSPSSNELFSSEKETVTRCRTSAKKTLTSKDSSIQVSYVEPQTRADGSVLSNLAKTTIYYDLGRGLVKVKDIPATSPKGGGKITETINVQIGPQETITAMICVTATDGDGREG